MFVVARNSRTTSFNGSQWMTSPSVCPRCCVSINLNVALYSGSFLVINGQVHDRGVHREFLVGAVTQVSPLRVHWHAPHNARSFLDGCWKPITNDGRAFIDEVAPESVLLLFTPSTSPEHPAGVFLTDDVITFLKSRKLS